MDWNGKGISKGIIAAFIMLATLVGIIGGLYLAQYVYAIVLGSVFEVTNTGSLPITNETTTFLGTAESSYFNTSTSVLDGASFAGSLIPIAVILLVFGALLVGGWMLYNRYKDKKGGGGDY